MVLGLQLLSLFVTWISRENENILFRFRFCIAAWTLHFILPQALVFPRNTVRLYGSLPSLWLCAANCQAFDDKGYKNGTAASNGYPLGIHQRFRSLEPAQLTQENKHGKTRPPFMINVNLRYHLQWWYSWQIVQNQECDSKYPLLSSWFLREY